MTTSSLAMLTDHFPAHKISSAVGMNEACTGIGFMAGPPIGGVIYDLSNFETPFIVMASVGIALLIAMPFLMRSMQSDTEVTEDDTSHTDEEPAEVAAPRCTAWILTGCACIGSISDDAVLVASCNGSWSARVPRHRQCKPFDATHSFMLRAGCVAGVYVHDAMMLVQVGFFDPTYASQASRTLGVGTAVTGVRMCCRSAAVCVMGVVRGVVGTLVCVVVECGG